MENKKIVTLIILLTFLVTTKAFASLTLSTNSIIGTSASTIDLGSGHDLYLQTNTGNVGIGTTVPTATLTVQGSGSNNPLAITSSTGSSILTANSIGHFSIGGSTTASTYLSINPAINEATSSDRALNGVLTLSNTSSPNSSFQVGIQGQITFSGANTQNWTAGPVTGGSAIVGVDATILGGGTGTVSNAVGVFSNVNNSAMTFTNSYNFLGIFPGSNVTNAAGLSIASLSTATNSAGVLLGTITIPTGKFGIYDATGFNDYFSGNIGIGTSAPNTNAILDVSSTTKAFMPPRMTTTQRDAIPSPTAGMVIYNSTTNKLNVYTTTWEAITSS